MMYTLDQEVVITKKDENHLKKGIVYNYHVEDGLVLIKLENGLRKWYKHDEVE